MYCKKCGFKLVGDETKCPFCGYEFSEKEEVKETESEPQIERQQEQIEDNQVEKYGVSNDKYEKAIKKNRDIIRTNLGFVDIHTKWWVHLLFACVGYILVEVLISVFASIGIIVKRNNGVDFSCVSLDGGLSSCPIAVQKAYYSVVNVSQVIGEILLVLIIALIFIKYIKVFFREFKDKNTWKWFGICVAISYVFDIVYSLFLNALGTEATSTNQDAVNDMIFSMPLFGFIFVVVAAPLFEEMIFRFGIFRSFTFKSKKLVTVGLILTMFVFAGIHLVATFQEVFSGDSPNFAILWSDLLSLPVYLSGGFAITFAYYKSKNLASPILVHMTMNAITFVAIMYNHLITEIESEAIVNFINLFTRL